MSGFSHGRAGMIVFAAHDDMLFKSGCCQIAPPTTETSTWLIWSTL
jgi:hypothetical protein